MYFEKIRGQRFAKKYLSNSIKSNMISHAYMFEGPSGVGKNTMARELAATLLDMENLFNSPDYIEITPDGNSIKIAQIRKLQSDILVKPYKSYKIYVIDEAQKMTVEAQNALLKTLEEPPAHVVFILATTEPHKILPTIISRCQRFDFTKLSMLDIVNRMKKVITEEHYQCDDEALEMIAKLADGGMRDALSILEQCLAFNDQHLTIQDVNQIYGIVSLENKIDFIKILLSKDMKKSLSMLEEMKMNGIDIKRLTLDLVDILKDIVIYRNTQDESILFVLSKFYLDMIVPYITCEEALTFIDILMEASEKYSKVINPSIYFELAILKICNQIKDEKVIHVETVAVPKVESPIQEIPKVAEIQASEPIEEPVEEILAEEIIDDSIQEEVIPEPILEQEEIEQEEIPTFEFEQKEEVQSQVDENIQIDPDDIMNILVQAKREILENIQERWPIIKRYLANLNTAKSAGMLCDGAAVAACPGGLIISFEFQPAVNAVNYYKNYKQLSSFLTEILGQEYRFIAVQQDDWLKIRSHFIELKKKGQLPQPHELTLKHIDSHDLDYVDLNEAQEFALKLFGDIVEFKED